MTNETLYLKVLVFYLQYQKPGVKLLMSFYVDIFSLWYAWLPGSGWETNQDASIKKNR